MKNGGVMGFLCIVDVHVRPKICAKQGDVIKRISDQVLDGGRGSGPDFWITAVP